MEGDDPNNSKITHVDVVVMFSDYHQVPLARYSDEECAKTYKRYLGMLINRSGMGRETALVIDSVSESSVRKLTKKFAEWDADAKARRESALEDENPPVDDFDANARPSI